jgi:hypothetical protein
MVGVEVDEARLPRCRILSVTASLSSMRITVTLGEDLVDAGGDAGARGLQRGQTLCRGSRPPRRRRRCQGSAPWLTLDAEPMNPVGPTGCALWRESSGHILGVPLVGVITAGPVLDDAGHGAATAGWCLPTGRPGDLSVPRAVHAHSLGAMAETRAAPLRRTCRPCPANRAVVSRVPVSPGRSGSRTSGCPRRGTPRPCSACDGSRFRPSPC